MWCKDCNIETSDVVCPICGGKTREDADVSIDVYWCEYCKTPIIHLLNQTNFDKCTDCGNDLKYMASDLRPVFPEERLMIELISGKEPNTYVKNSVWANKTRFFVDGKLIQVPLKKLEIMDAEWLRKELNNYSSKNTDEYFKKHISNFIKANQNRLNSIKNEAFNFVKNEASKFNRENIVVSFSGGKDSTVTADVVVKALSDPTITHVWGDTTLEFPSTLEYADRFRADHPFTVFIQSRNEEQNFYEVCDIIGPPARMMRWCCSMFKTGPITRILNKWFRGQRILTFYGIRKCESVSRSKYNRVEDDATSVKIQKQTVASPIFFWNDIDIWLYILSEKIDFNDAYRLGYERVGCWCCPNNNLRAQYLSRIYMPEKSQLWRNKLIDFAKKVGKPDPEVYVDTGKWKARQGGNGLESTNDVKIKFTNCTTEEHAKIYKLSRPFSDELVQMFVPFGEIRHDLGRKLLDETLVLDIKTRVPIISIQPFTIDGFENSVKIKTMNVASHDELQRMIGYQIRKYNACQKCLKCESLCNAGAISVSNNGYLINPNKCVHCKMCVIEKYLCGGCLMSKYLRTKDA